MTKETALDILKNYLYEKRTKVDDDYIASRLREYDNNPTKLLSRIFHELDCSRLMPDSNIPIISTISLTYRSTINEALWVIELMDNQNEMYDRLIAIHTLNLAYEKDNPPPVYKNIARKKPVKKESKAKRESKVVQQKIPINMLKFNLKFNLK